MMKLITGTVLDNTRMRYGLIALLALVGAMLVMFFAPNRTSSPTVQGFLMSEPLEQVGQALHPHQALSSSDAVLYRTLFRAQMRGDWDTADEALMEIADQRLLGTVLSQRYLHEKYPTKTHELTAWLSNYGDQPEVERIARLARHKGVKTEAFELASMEPMAGRGYVETIGNVDRPGAWYSGISAWKQKSYGSAAQYFSAAAKATQHPWHISASLYWAWRSHSMNGDTARANLAIRQAATYPNTFYGMLSTATLGQTPDVAASAPYVSSELRANPAVARAAALSQIGEYSLAEQELRTLYKGLAPEQRMAVVTLASEMNLPNLQVRLAGMKGLTSEEARFAAYPMPRWLSDEQRTVAPALMFAISRQESSFATGVQSGAGATGLMQLMPATANYVWQKSSESLLASLSTDTLPENTKRLAAAHLSDPEMNLLIGQEYLRYLLAKKDIDGNLVYVLAAYNAGPGMLSVWNKSANNLDDPLLYVESIPYTETRHYVMQVLTNYWTYQTLMGEDAESLEALAGSGWPKISE
jgi:soluble lytic murein transglycosylase